MSEEALRALEDVTIFNNLRRGKEYEMETDALNAATVALKERNNRLAALQHDRNNEVIHATALEKTLDHVVRDFAKFAGVAEDKLMARYNLVRTQHYNSSVNEGMGKGWFDLAPVIRIS